MEITAPLRSKRGIWPAIGLIVVAPLVAEFLLGNLPIKFLPALVLLAPMYGGGRAVDPRGGAALGARMAEHRHPCAGLRGIIEEAYTTQSLFNPNYLKLNLHLLQPAYIPALGIGAWWTVFVLTLHTAWSISTSIALVETAVPDRAETPWPGEYRSWVTATLFALGAAVGTLMQLHRDPFVATRGQLLISGAICIGLIVVAFLLPRRSATRDAGVALNPWIIGILGLVAGGAVLVVPSRWNWWGCGCHRGNRSGGILRGLGMVAARWMEPASQAGVGWRCGAGIWTSCLHRDASYFRSDRCYPYRQRDFLPGGHIAHGLRGYACRPNGWNL